jgi:hypothetical protein
MRIVPCKHGLEDLVGVSPGGRTHEKLHISDLYGRYYEVTDPKRFKHTGPPNPLYLEMGLTFEQMLEDKFKERMSGVSRPGELTTAEGIVYSPDLIIFNGVTRLGEIKLTWMSSKEMPDTEANGLPPKFEKWITQIMAYSFHLETPYARLIAFFVNGAYKQMVPELRAWDLEFTSRELHENWDKLIRLARHEGMI